MRDLLADNPNDFVWKNTNGVFTHRSGADLIDNGLFVGLPNTNAGTGSYHAQYLQLVDVSPRDFSFSPPQFMTYGTTNTLTASVTPPTPVTYSLVSGDTNKVALTGNQLVIYSGTGSVTVRAAIAEGDGRPADSKEATITFQKATQTINFLLNPASVAAGASVPLNATATSGLPVTYSSSRPGVATINTNGTNFSALGVAAGSSTITASQIGNENYELAGNIDQVLTVTAETFETLFGAGTENTDSDGDNIPALVEYAIGGSTNSNDQALLPALSTNPMLSLVAVVRTNDRRLTNQVLTSTDLTTNPSANWITNPAVVLTIPSNQSNVLSGFQRQIYSWTNAPTNSRAFMRLRLTLQPTNSP